MEGNQINSYKDLVVWQKAMDLVVLVYKLTELFPEKEAYNLISQIRRAAVSIPSNIAEGRSRNTRKDFCRFLTDSFASASELETQIEISKRLKLCNSQGCEKIDILLLEVLKMLKVMISKLIANNLEAKRTYPQCYSYNLLTFSVCDIIAVSSR